MNARQDTAWKNLSFYRGYLPPADREKVKEYLLLALGDEVPAAGNKREGSMESVTIGTAAGGLNLPPTPTLTTSLVADLLSPVSLTDSAYTLAAPLGTFKVEAFDAFPAPPPLLSCASGCVHMTPQTSTLLSPLAVSAGPAPTKRLEYKRFFMIKKSNLAQVPHFKSFLFKVKKCLEICSNPQPCNSPECHNVHVEVEGNLNLIELQFEPASMTAPDAPILSVNRGNQLPSLSVRACDMERTAGALFCFGLMKHQITQAVQGTQCRFGDKCRYGNKCLFIHLKDTIVDEAPVDNIVNITEAETQIRDALPILKDHSAFVERLKELGMETVGDVQILSNTAFDSIVSRSAADDHGLWGLVHTLREVKERDVPLPLALATFPGVPGDRVSTSLEQHRLESINQLLTLKPKAFYALRLPPKIMDACERIRLRYEPEREAYSTIDLTRLPAFAFIRRAVQQVLTFRLDKAHKSWRKQDATRPIVTSLITYVEASECCCHIQGTFSATQTPALGFSATSRTSAHRDPTSQSPQKGATVVPSSVGAATTDSSDHPDNSWCRCPRKYEIAVNYELSTPSGSRCSEQNCLGKLASMGLATCAIREIFVHGDMHNNEDPNPLFPCGVCENMLRRITHDVQKQFGGDVTLYMFDQVIAPKKLVCIPVQEISHREGSSFKRFIQEDLRGDMEDKFNSSLT